MNNSTAHIISTVLHPLLMPFYGMLILLQTSFFTLFPTRLKVMYAIGVFCFTGLFPALFIYILSRMGFVQNHEISNEKERTYPYLFTFISYATCIFFLYRLMFPSWGLFLFTGAAIATLINVGVNFFWKISAHLAAIGGLTGGVFVVCDIFRLNPTSLFIGVVLSVGLVATSRLTLKQHTPAQVIGGFANGFICVFLSLRIALQFI